MPYMRRISNSRSSRALALALLAARQPRRRRSAEVGVIPATTPADRPQLPRRPRAWRSAARPASRSRSAPRTTPLRAPRDGTIVAWTISLGKPNATQIKFFNANEGGAAEAGDRDPAPAAQAQPHLQARRAEPAREARAVLRQDRPVPARNTIPVKKGDIVALTVPTWAPALALGLRQRHLLAGEPAEGSARDERADPHTAIGSAVQYYCLYQTARLTYSATLISTP